VTLETEIKAATTSERLELAEVLSTLPPHRWDEATLCEGWRVRETVAHITMPFRYSAAQFLVGMLKARGSFHRMADRAARHDATTMTPEELLASLKDNAAFEWKPPGGGLVGALSHDVIHGLDITTALGLDRVVPPDRLSTVLDSIDARRVAYFGVDLKGIELRADDLEWSFGSGTPLTGRAQDLLLVLCGRTLPAGRLHGEPGRRFTRTSG
jgi:uncharacterized protein (TIGR03083 family)